MLSPRVVASLSLVAALAAQPATASACSCLAPPPPAEARDASQDVFEGRVVAIEAQAAPGAGAGGDATSAPPPGLPAGTGGVRVALDVVRTWKGADTERIVVETGPDSAGCGYAFEEGRSYLVYTTPGTDGGPPQTGLCTRTRPIGEAGDDLSALGAGVVPVDVDETAEAPRTESQAPDGGGCASGGQRPGTGLSAGLLIAALALRRRRGRQPQGRTPWESVGPDGDGPAPGWMPARSRPPRRGPRTAGARRRQPL